MTRKFIVFVLLCVLLITVFVACNDKAPNNTTEPTESTEPQAPTIPTPTVGSKTLLIYMCGSNLETKQGLAGKNIDELLSAEIGENVNVVIQTGGAKTWRKHGISNTESERYIIKDGKLTKLESFSNYDMGDADTLSDFLKWGQQNYYAEQNMLVLWDHGAGAVKGVCFDENYGFDALTLTELKKALSDAQLYVKYDIIGFDACLMATIETADTVQDYAKYMVASEEVEPSGGWNYKALAEAFSSNADPLETGKTICDSFVEKSVAAGKGTLASLSVFDLSKTDDVIEKFGDFIVVLEKNLGENHFASFITDTLNRAYTMGGDRTASGCSNMVDLLSFVIYSGLKFEDDVDYMNAIIHDSVAYFVQGSERYFTAGLSFYYPELYNQKEIADYISLGISDVYNDYLNEYYMHVPSKTVEFVDRGTVAEDGAFSVKLTPESEKYASSIDYLLIHTDEDGKQHILYSGNDIKDDWDESTFKSNFKGTTIALDGHPMFFSCISSSYIVKRYISPIIVNGKRTNYIFLFLIDDEEVGGGIYMPFALWDGYDENGLPSSEYYDLKAGDRIKVLCDSVVENNRNIETWSDEFVIEEDEGNFGFLPLAEKTYQYVFVVTDIFGNTFFSDMATFEMKYTYEYLLENPLSDGTYAADVTDIKPYN